MDEQKNLLRQEIRQLEKDLAEQEQRIPPHSVRPEHIQELERLEEELARRKEQLQQLGNDRDAPE
ncbi:MAG: hypothetical protein ACLFPD_01910 [Desulfosudaceae bacterium]